MDLEHLLADRQRHDHTADARDGENVIDAASNEIAEADVRMFPQRGDHACRQFRETRPQRNECQTDDGLADSQVQCDRHGAFQKEVRPEAQQHETDRNEEQIQHDALLQGRRLQLGILIGNGRLFFSRDPDGHRHIRHEQDDEDSCIDSRDQGIVAEPPEQQRRTDGDRHFPPDERGA